MNTKKRFIEYGELEGERISTGNTPISSRSNQLVIPASEVCTKKNVADFLMNTIA